MVRTSRGAWLKAKTTSERVPLLRNLLVIYRVFALSQAPLLVRTIFCQTKGLGTVHCLSNRYRSDRPRSAHPCRLWQVLALSLFSLVFIESLQYTLRAIR